MRISLKHTKMLKEVLDYIIWSEESHYKECLADEGYEGEGEPIPLQDHIYYKALQLREAFKQHQEKENDQRGKSRSINQS